MAAPIIHFDLDSPYELAKEQIRFYRENGFVRLKKVLPAEVLEHYRNEISAKVQELNTERLPLEQRSVYGRAFLQVTNLWTKSEIVMEFVTSKRLARITAELMGCRGVRLYHDQALYKEPGGGFTPWHADQYYWPVNTDNIVTAWIPLQDTPVEMGTPAFSPGDRKSTRLNSSHVAISYAVFCLKKKKKQGHNDKNNIPQHSPTLTARGS